MHWGIFPFHFPRRHASLLTPPIMIVPYLHLIFATVFIRLYLMIAFGIESFGHDKDSDGLLLYPAGKKNYGPLLVLSVVYCVKKIIPCLQQGIRKEPMMTVCIGTKIAQVFSRCTVIVIYYVPNVIFL